MVNLAVCFVVFFFLFFLSIIKMYPKNIASARKYVLIGLVHKEGLKPLQNE